SSCRATSRLPTPPSATSRSSSSTPASTPRQAPTPSAPPSRMARDPLEQPEIGALVERSRRLGSDPRVTNFGGGNTSAKVELADPITGESRTVLAVKGSGGDLGTLTAGGLALVDLERLRSMERVYEGLEREDDMVALLDHARFGPGGAVPSIDTPLHGFLPAAHVDHLHPDALIAFAAAADGPARVADA